MNIRTETLPTANYIDGKWQLGEPYDKSGYVTCSVYGEMAKGEKVWVSNTGKQYTRQKLFGKYYFCEM